MSLADDLGIEYPIFAFSHCRDVVAAVTNAGGMGVLGALAFTPDELEPYRDGDGFVSYLKLTPADTRKLSQAIDALAEPLSRVGAIVVAAQ